MSDFASAAMVRVLRQGLADLGFDPGPEPAAASARVDLDLKRTLVTHAVAQGGLGCLPLLGRGLHRHANEPTHVALASAQDAADLFARWQRLERYIHSRHRIEVRAVRDGAAELEHLARSGLAPPLAAEDLVVLGVLAALLEAIGAVEVSVSVAGVPAYPQPDAAALMRLAARGRTGAWRLRWSGAPGRGAAAGAHDPPADLVDAEPWPAVAHALARELLRDLMRPPALPELARSLALAPRTLQRALGCAGLSATRVLAETRLRAAAWRLVETDLPLAEVGFVCGYADQPHFTRRFRDRVGLTPARYREEFGRG